MTETTASAPNRTYTFEDVWAAIMEDKKRLEEYKQWQEESWKKQEEAEEKRRAEEAERKKELDIERKKTERSTRKLNKQMGELHRKFGKIAEHMVAPCINKRFNELGYHFGTYWRGGLTISDEKGKIIAEIDFVLENHETIMAVEVKMQPLVKDMAHHIKRLELLRNDRDNVNDKRKIQGAIAGAIFGTDEKKAAIEAGFYVIEQSGDTMKIEVPEGFVPREW